MRNAFLRSLKNIPEDFMSIAGIAKVKIPMTIFKTIYLWQNTVPSRNSGCKRICGNRLLRNIFRLAAENRVREPAFGALATTNRTGPKSFTATISLATIRRFGTPRRNYSRLCRTERITMYYQMDNQNCKMSIYDL